MRSRDRGETVSHIEEARIGGFRIVQSLLVEKTLRVSNHARRLNRVSGILETRGRSWISGSMDTRTSSNSSREPTMSLWDDLRNLELFSDEEEGVFTRTRTSYRIGGRRSRTELTSLGNIVTDLAVRVFAASVDRYLESASDRRKLGGNDGRDAGDRELGGDGDGR